MPYIDLDRYPRGLKGASQGPKHVTPEAGKNILEACRYLRGLKQVYEGLEQVYRRPEQVAWKGNRPEKASKLPEKTSEEARKDIS